MYSRLRVIEVIIISTDHSYLSIDLIQNIDSQYIDPDSNTNSASHTLFANPYRNPKPSCAHNLQESAHCRTRSSAHTANRSPPQTPKPIAYNPHLALTFTYHLFYLSTQKDLYLYRFSLEFTMVNKPWFVDPWFYLIIHFTTIWGFDPPYYPQTRLIIIKTMQNCTSFP